MTQATHTPLPWAVERGEIECSGYGGSFNKYHTVTGPERFNDEADDTNLHLKCDKLDDAEFIVRACNGHYELCAALVALLDDIADWGEFNDRLKSVLDARAAIAKATQ